MKLIFLDIDGVMNVIPQGRDVYGACFHKHFEANLKRIIDATGAKIVISSTWRSAGLKEMQDMWKFRGLAGEVIDITPTGNTDVQYYDRENTRKGASTPRGVEISAWLSERGYYEVGWSEQGQKEAIEKSGIESYVIIDDDRDMLLGQADNFVCCSENHDHEDKVDWGYGLTSKSADKAIEILNKNG